MTTEPAQPSAPTEPKPPAPADPKPAEPTKNPLTQSLLVAGLVGGLLGGLFSFVLARALPVTPKPPAAPPPSEARQFAEHVLGQLRDGKNDEFMRYLRPAFAHYTPEQFERFRKDLFDQRIAVATRYGGSGEFEYCRETTLSPTLVRLTYLEKYTHGCVMWLIAVYHSPDGWQVVACNVRVPESGFPELQ